MSMYWILFIGVAVLSYVVQYSFQRKFKKASELPVLSGMTGQEVAQKMLADHGIRDVRVTSTRGQLTDNFNPTNKTVNLSEAVYNQAHVAAAAVAAHECGHVGQHATGYAPLRLRSALVPVVSFASKWVQWVLLAGVIFIARSGHNMGMPVSGLELLEILKQDPSCRDISVFVISAAQGEEAAYEKNMTRFFRGVKVLKKPLTTPELLAELTALYPEPAVLP